MTCSDASRGVTYHLHLTCASYTICSCIKFISCLRMKNKQISKNGSCNGQLSNYTKTHPCLLWMCGELQQLVGGCKALLVKTDGAVVKRVRPPLPRHLLSFFFFSFHFLFINLFIFCTCSHPPPSCPSIPRLFSFGSNSVSTEDPGPAKNHQCSHLCSRPTCKSNVHTPPGRSLRKPGSGL